MPRLFQKESEAYLQPHNGTPTTISNNQSQQLLLATPQYFFAPPAGESGP